MAPPKDFNAWQPFPPADRTLSASTSGATSVRAMRPVAAYRAVVLLVWGLAAYATVTCRGLFWDGSSFLVNILDHGHFHDFYVARAHVDWVTQMPVLLLAKLGVRDTRLLAMAYSAALFALPTALYHLALARVRHDAVLLGIVDRRGRRGLSADVVLHHRRVQRDLCRRDRRPWRWR